MTNEHQLKLKYSDQQVEMKHFKNTTVQSIQKVKL